MLHLRRAMLSFVLAATIAVPNATYAAIQDSDPEAETEAAIAAMVAPYEQASSAEKTAAARRLYEEAETHSGHHEWSAAIRKYRAAYELVPDKHGFAYKVGSIAWKTGDCKIAHRYFTMLVEKGASEPKLQDKVSEAKSTLWEIERSGCAEGSGKKSIPVEVVNGDEDGSAVAEASSSEDADPVREPSTPPRQVKRFEPEDDADDIVFDDENPLGPSKRTERETRRRQVDRAGRRPLSVVGWTAVSLGVAGLAVGGTFQFLASQNANELVDSASSKTPTNFPTGDFGCRDADKICPYSVELTLATNRRNMLIGYGAGGGLALLGTTLLITRSILMRRDASRLAQTNLSRSLVVIPTMSPGIIGAAATGRF